MHAYAPNIAEYQQAPTVAALPARKRDRLGDRYLTLLGIVLIGYALGGKGFAYWGVNPIFIGEVTLLFGLYYLLKRGGLFRVIMMVEFAPLILFMGWGLLRTIPFVGPYGFNAFRDAVLWAYGLFSFITCGLFISRPERMAKVLPYYRKFVWVFLIMAPVLLALGKAGFEFPDLPNGSGVQILQPKGGDIACHTVGVFAYICIFGRTLNPWLSVISIPFILAMCITGRAAMVTFVGGAAAFCMFKPLNWRALRVIGVLVIGLILLWATEFRTGEKGDTRELSFDYLQRAMTSIFTDKSEGDMSGTKEWRMNWWKDIIDYTIHGKFFWEGKGFGVNLAEESGLKDEAESGLRSPHNGHLTVLARAGVIGVALWSFLHLYWVWLIMKNFFRAKRRKDWKWAGLFLSLFAYWVAFMANTSFDVFLEGPMGGVWFWSLYGFGIACEWIFLRYPYVLYMEPEASARKKRKNRRGAPPHGPSSRPCHKARRRTAFPKPRSAMPTVRYPAPTGVRAGADDATVDGPHRPRMSIGSRHIPPSSNPRRPAYAFHRTPSATSAHLVTLRLTPPPVRWLCCHPKITSVARILVGAAKREWAGPRTFDGDVRHACPMRSRKIHSFDHPEVEMSFSSPAIRRAFVLALIVCALVVAATPRQAHAIGWDSDDFLIGGGPSFTTKIGVFDHDLSFKGYLDSNFVTVQGMDFDAAGRLVAVAPALGQVRVYDSTGAQVGGFTKQDGAISASQDLKVSRQDGSYVIAQQNQSGADGARRFSDTGTFLQQYSSGDIEGAAVVPGDRLWISGPNSPVHVFDLSTGQSSGSISVVGMRGATSMFYSAASNSVLLVDEAVKRVFEVSLAGDLVRTFVAPPVGDLDAVTRGPNGEIFVTTGGGQSVRRWSADGTPLDSIAMPAGFGVNGIVWAGTVPEPAFGSLLIIGAVAACGRNAVRRAPC